MQEPNDTSTQDSSQDWTFKTEEEIQLEQTALKVSAPTPSKEILVFSESSPCIMNIYPTRYIQFYDENHKEVGTIDLKDGIVTYLGNFDEGAKAFCKAMQPYMLQAFEDAKQQFKHDVLDFMNKVQDV